MKKLRNFLLLLLFQACIYCNAQSRELSFAKAELSKHYDLSLAFHTKSELACTILSSQVLAWKPTDSVDFILHKTRRFYRYSTLDSICLDTVFSFEDSVFMAKQFKSQLNSEGIWIGYAKMKILEPKSLRKKGKLKPHWEFSNPIFSKDMQKCLVKIQYFYSKTNYVFKTMLLIRSKDGSWEEEAVISDFHSVHL